MRSVLLHDLIKFRRTNQDTCEPTPLVKRRRAGDERPGTRGLRHQPGRTALGRKYAGAFMPWQGYNRVDAIVIPERGFSDDIFTRFTLRSLS
jgi:DNA-directed RNA polymerase beta subunit